MDLACKEKMTSTFAYDPSSYTCFSVKPEKGNRQFLPEQKFVQKYGEDFANELKVVYYLREMDAIDKQIAQLRAKKHDLIQASLGLQGISIQAKLLQHKGK